MKLFEDDEGDLDDKIEIDKEFAKRYDHNKKREALQRYEELKKRGLASSSDTDSEESSSEDEELMKPSKKKDSKFFDALLKLKKKDPVLADSNAKLFSSDSESDGDSGSEGVEKGKSKKPLYLKDVNSKHLIERGPEFSDEEMQHAHGKEKGVKSYAEEQEELRREFFEAEAEVGEDEEGDLFRVKNSVSKDGEDEEEDDGDDQLREKMDAFFGEDDKLEPDWLYLKEFFRDRKWCDNGKDKDHESIELSEDEEEIEKQEDYEREFNFRFEENSGDRVLGHSRNVEGSVRKKNSKRKAQRERKQERIAQAELERKEELKRLKNLKKKEINEKLEKIRQVAGIGKDASVFLDKHDLEDEFDPDKYDKKMKEAFDDGYYNAEDADSGFGTDDDGAELVKPDFDKEDELLGLGESSSACFQSVREKVLKKTAADGDGDDDSAGEEEEEENSEPVEGKRKRKRELSEVEKAVREELMEEYYKLDYEDTIGDLKTRFKYKPVKAKRYGLTPEEVLTMDDKDLNQYVSLKKLAPYREKEWKVPRIQTVQLKQKAKKLFSENGGSTKVKENESDMRDTETKNEIGATSRKSMRRRRQSELKLSHSRLMAYGKIPSKGKSKKNSQ